MKVVDSARRQIVMVVLLALAVTGAAIRFWAPDPSVARDVGTLLLVMWLPAVGALVGFVMRKLPARKQPPADAAWEGEFIAHITVEVRVVADAELALAAGAGQRRWILVADREGFTARLDPHSLPSVAPGAVLTADVQFLRPELALGRCAPGASIQLFAGAKLMADGSVLARSPS